MINHLSHYFFPFDAPFVAVGGGIVEALCASDSKYIALFQLFCQRNDVIIKKPKLPLANKKSELISASR